MLLKRAREEILLTKKEMPNYLHFLVSKRSSLLQFIQQNVHEEDKFAKGKKVLSAAEIQRLYLKIKVKEIQYNRILSDTDLFFKLLPTPKMVDRQFKQTNGTIFTKLFRKYSNVPNSNVLEFILIYLYKLL